VAALRYAIVGALLLALAIVTAASGELPLKRGNDPILRATSPTAFWLFLAVLSALGAGSIAWAVRLWKNGPEE
jgi:hypothetical protein